MLKTERNTPTMGARVKRAFRKSRLNIRACYPPERKRKGFYRRRVCSNFEHGQWWITDLDTGAQWSVCDGVGFEADGFDGFCFELVTKGDDA